MTATLHEPPLLHIDIPPDRTIRGGIISIVGWFSFEGPLERTQLFLGKHPLPFLTMNRPDVTAALPGKAAIGFCAVAHLKTYLDVVTNGFAPLFIDGTGVREEVEEIRVLEEALEVARQAKSVVDGKREWVRSHVRCPLCRSEEKRLSLDDPERIVCPACDAVFPQDSGALNLIEPGVAASLVQKTETAISHHNYDENASDLIEEVSAAEGWVLDCGAGLRERPHPRVISLDIEGHATTDVMGANQALPFPDATFDGVLSLNVLEHVADPFVSAREIHRVLKPGGRLYCVVPFLQPEHGYPEHYFNMTRAGLRLLFSEGMVLERQFVPASGHPIWALRWLLSWYTDSLAPDLRERFRGMTAEEIVDRPIEDWLSDSLVTQLPTEAAFRLGATTALLMRKE